MELSKTFLKLFNIFFPFTDFLYILQQEEYSLQRVWFWMPRFFFRRNIQKRDRLVYTTRAKMTIAVSLLFFIVLNFSTYFFVRYYSLSFIVLCILIPCIVLFANALLNPLYAYFKKRMILRTHTYFQKVRGSVKVVAVTGSYGKTTVKNSIEQLVKVSFKTQMIPGNINSTIGIAQWIVKEFRTGTEVLIVEMDSYFAGRIAMSTMLVVPDIALITNIGDQHLQRYKTREHLAQSLYELFEASPDTTYKITNTQTRDYLKSLHVKTDDISTTPESILYDSFSQSHNENITYAVYVAQILGVPSEYIDHILKNIVLPERRQSHSIIAGFDGIDDSYNISFTTASAGITEARYQAHKQQKKLIVITAGIPELGPDEQDKNTKLGILLEQQADAIIVLGSIFAKDIIVGITTKEKVYTYVDFNSALEGLRATYKPTEWFVLLQPELTDLYY